MKTALGWLWVALLVSLPLWMTNLYYLHVIIIAGIFIITAMSLNLMLGYTGQLNLGQVGFFGVGAYVSALTSLGSERSPSRCAGRISSSSRSASPK
jgi:branched-chain amino acid transport system permease protein